MNLAAIFPGNLDGLLAVASLEHLITELRQNEGGQRADPLFILGQQNRFGSAGHGVVFSLRANRFAGGMHPWKVDVDSGALSRLAFNADVTAALAYDSIDGG